MPALVCAQRRWPGLLAYHPYWLQQVDGTHTRLPLAGPQVVVEKVCGLFVRVLDAVGVTEALAVLFGRRVTPPSKERVGRKLVSDNKKGMHHA